MTNQRLEYTLYDTIAEIQDMKRFGKVHPDYALLTEIHNSLKPEYGDNLDSMKPQILEALRNLYRAKLVMSYKTVNGVLMFDIINELKR